MVSGVSQTFGPSTGGSHFSESHNACTLSLISSTAQPVSGNSTAPMGIDPVTSVLLARQMPPSPKFGGEVSDGEHRLITFEDWLEHFELIATTLLRLS